MAGEAASMGVGLFGSENRRGKDEKRDDTWEKSHSWILFV